MGWGGGNGMGRRQWDGEEAMGWGGGNGMGRLGRGKGGEEEIRRGRR